MFIHNFKYSFKTLFRDKMLIFWTFAFPLILATFFNMAFSNIENSEKLDIIDIAIVNNESYNQNTIFKEAFNTLGDSNNKDQLFNITYVEEDEAKALLEDKKISGYFIMNNEDSKVVVSTSGINETILKSVVEEITQTTEMINTTVTNEIKKELASGNTNIDYEKIYQEALKLAQNDEANIKNISSSNLSYTMIEFYTLIAMTCLYSGMLAMTAVNHNLANMSHNGKRISVSPLKKGKLIISSLLASFITQLIGLALLFAYTIFILKIDYGNNVLLIIALSVAGCLAGLSLGVAIASLLRTTENNKTGILISITMLGSFLSGMMGITMKYIIDKNIPILNIINPASMITDGLYSLYYYDTLNRYIFNIVSLLIFSGIMMFISYFSLRRQKYDSI